MILTSLLILLIVQAFFKSMRKAVIVLVIFEAGNEMGDL